MILVAILRDGSVQPHVPQTVPVTVLRQLFSCEVARRLVSTIAVETAHLGWGQNVAFSAEQEQLVGLSFEDNPHHQRFLGKRTDQLCSRFPLNQPRQLTYGDHHYAQTESPKVVDLEGRSV